MSDAKPGAGYARRWSRSARQRWPAASSSTSENWSFSVATPSGTLIQSTTLAVGKVPGSMMVGSSAA